MNEPLVCADQWRTVMEAAGFRCQCTGCCGNQHTKAGGRCPRKHGQYASKRRGPVQLAAAPADPATPTGIAVRLPPGELRAWCADCHDAACRVADRAVRTRPGTDQGCLFEV